MSKINQRIDQAVAGDLGTTLAPRTTTLKEIIGFSEDIDYFILAFEQDDLICYDQLPIWRIVNGMRIKVPKFQSHPLIEERLKSDTYKRFYVVVKGLLFRLKINRVAEFHERLPITINDQMAAPTIITVETEPMGLRKKSLLINRQRALYES